MQPNEVIHYWRDVALLRVAESDKDGATEACDNFENCMRQWAHSEAEKIFAQKVTQKLRTAIEQGFAKRELR